MGKSGTFTTTIAPDRFWVDDASAHNITGNFTVQPLDTIQGKMLTASLTMSPYEAEQMDDLELKNRLISLMVREIMDNKCIEFTKQQDYTMDTVTVRARIYVTPDSDVKLIRQIQK